MPIYREHLSIGNYEFIEIEADTLEELIERREAYLKSKEKPKDETQKFNEEVDEVVQEENLHHF